LPLVPFSDLMYDAECNTYAVGYFECWNLESLMAVADAAETTRSPVLLGFSGIYLPHPHRTLHEPLSVYAAMGLETCRQLSVPAALVFNESPHMDSVAEAVDLGFSLVMFSDEKMPPEAQMAQVRRTVEVAHPLGVAVEGEDAALPGVGGGLTEAPEVDHMTDPLTALHFVEATGVDAFAVNIGQKHFHGRREVRLDLELLDALKRTVPAPLVLHGATSVNRLDLQQAVQRGIRKVNVGSILKQAYLRGLRQACAELGEDHNPYEVIGSGLPVDVLVAGRRVMQEAVEDLMRLLGSAGKARARVDTDF
jgi:ketose-bisphosphate aldolase